MVAETEADCPLVLTKVIAESSTRAQVDLITSVAQNLFPNITSNSSSNAEENLQQVFKLLAKHFDIIPNKSHLKRFREAVIEVSVAKYEACNGSSRLDIKDVSELIQDFVSTYNMDKRSRDGHQLRRLYGKLQCIKSTIYVNSVTRRRRDSDCPKGCGPILAFQEAACFFRCLDSEDTVKEIFFISGEALEDNPCLAFVIDTTGSMTEEINDAKRIILDFLRSEEEIGETGCYILVPFNYVGPHEESKQV